MATLLQLQDGHKRYGEQRLLDGASISLSDDVKVGLIGRNGSGKTTLCRVLMEKEELEAGEVIRFPDLRLGYLRQGDPFRGAETVMDFLLRDTGEPEWRCAEVAARFEIRNEILETPALTLSGGWQTRVKLAALLLHDPNLLLLDEPTNFLDLRTQILLEHFLKDFRGGCLIVSHDRTFLVSTCTHTVEMARGQLVPYAGNVEAYLEQKKRQREHDEKVNATILAKRRHLQRFIDKNRARPQTATQARSKKRQLDRLELIDIEADESTARIRVPEVEVRKGPAFRCEGLGIGYPGNEVARDIDFEIVHGNRVAVVGDNGQGKTTFLRTVAGSLPSLGGEVLWGHAVSVGYYAQLVYSNLSEDGTVFDYLERRTSVGVSPQAVRNVAGGFLFQDEDVNKPVSVLSGGERARLCLAGLLLGGHNVLILDEPGNHLDVESVDALAEALIHYQGTVLFTSHDRHFLNRVATGVVEVIDGRIASFPGGYEAYLYHVSKEIEDGERAREKEKKAETRKKKKKKAKPAADKGEARHRFRMLREASTLERQMTRLDEKRMELEERLHNTADLEASQAVHEELTAVKRELGEVEDRWLKLQERIEVEE